MRWLVLLSLMVSSATAAQRPPRLAGADLQAWRADLKFLARELPARHPNPYHSISRPRLAAEFRALEARLPRLSRAEAIVGLMRVVASIGDGHTALNPFFVPTGFRRFPVRLFAFEDGIFVREADSAHADMVGARVIRIGGTTAEAALDSAITVLSHENEWFARRYGADLMSVAEILAALHVIPGADRATFLLQRGGREWSVDVASEPMPAGGHGGPPPVILPGWVDGAPAEANRPLWLREPTRPYWFTFLPDSRTLYICYRAVQSTPGDPLGPFFARAFALADSQQAARVVLDIRDNGGGDNFLNRAVIREILRRPALDQRDRLFVIVGGRTYSAAQNLVNDLSRLSNATFVGEPTGSPINIFGDHAAIALPRTGLAVLYAQRYWAQNPGDQRLAFEPDWYTPLSWTDYMAGHDPALEAILNASSRPSLADRLRPALAAGDTIAAAQELDSFRKEPLNRFRNVESEVNALGYQLLREDRVSWSIAVFRLNTGAFPRSGNTFDSLGEALERAGRAAEALASYRHALELDPSLSSSRDAVRRLEGSKD